MAKVLVFALVAIFAIVDAGSPQVAPCTALRRKQNDRPRMGGFSPLCDEQGFFQPVQRKGAILHCSSKNGDDLSFSSHVSTAQDKNCKCAVAQFESDRGRKGKRYVCDALGNFEKVQCSDDTCYCSDPHGVKINGTESPLTSYYSKHCGCATASHAFKQTGLVGQRFNCDSLGNYEKIQCRGSVCHCVDFFGNQINDTARPVSQYSEIVCPEREPVSEVQPCKTKILSQMRRTKGTGPIHHSCDDDGFFNLVQMRGSSLLCMSPDGRYLGYPTRSNDLDAWKKNCQCAADEYAKNPDSYVAASRKCDKMGNYKPRQCNLSGECYCVDIYGNRSEDIDC